MNTSVKILAWLLTGLALTALAGCSGISVAYDYDTEANFQAFQTYDWVQKDTVDPQADAQQATLNNGLLDKRLHQAIGREMTARGLNQTSDDPDLLVVYYAGSQDKIQITDWGYRYGRYWGYGGRDIDVYAYTEGQLIIDLVDAHTKELVWRGSGTKVINDTPKSPEKIQADINQAVHKIMESFPPPSP